MDEQPAKVTISDEIVEMETEDVRGLDGTNEDGEQESELDSGSDGADKLDVGVLMLRVKVQWMFIKHQCIKHH